MQAAGFLRRNTLLLAIATVAAASQATGGEFELTLLGGLRLGGQFEDASTYDSRWLEAGPSFGLALGFPLEEDRTLEVVWTHQEGEVGDAPADADPVALDLDTIGVGGTYEWSRGKRRPFVSGTAGLTILSPEQSDLDREALLTMTLGGGVKFPISPRADIRLEGRGIMMIATSSVAGVCGGGGCVLGFSGAGLAQFELLAGVSWSP